MAKFEITGPDGSKFEVTAPDNASESDVLAYAQQQLAQNSAIERNKTHQQGVNEAFGRMGDAIYGATKGAADLVQAPAQLIINGAAALSGEGPAGRWVKDRAQQFNTYLADQERQYQEDTPGSAAAGLGRVAAGVAPFLLSGGESAIPQAVNAAKSVPLAGKLANALRSSATAGSKGALYAGGTQPVTSNPETPDDFLQQKAMQAGVGGAASMAAQPAAAVLARLIKPNTSSDVKALLDAGVTPTPGQILGGALARAEEKATSIPLVGDLIKNSQRRATEDFNRAAYARALAPIGEKPTAQVGRAGVEEVKTKLGDAYDNLLPKLQFRADPQFSSEISNLAQMVQNGNVSPEISRQFNSILKNEVFSRMTRQGAMGGETFKELETKLGQEIKRFGSSQDPNHQAVSDALKEVLNSARGALSRGNPQYSDQLAKINEGYANYVRVRSASSSLGADDGVFTAAQLQNAVKANDRSVGKGKFATGNALMQDLSESGKSVLGSKYPDSGTPGRAMFAALPAAAGAAYYAPATTALAALGGTVATAPYTALGQKLAAALLAKRPAVAGPIADAVRSGAPLAGGAVSPALLQMLNNGSQ